MASCPDVFKWLIVLFLVTLTDCQVGDLKNKMGVAYFEFKIHVDAGKEECFHEFVHPGASVYVAFQVMRGGDGQAGFAIKNQNGAFLLPYQWRPSAEFDEPTSQAGGFYEMCIDNSLSRFASKLVSVYFHTFKREEWESFVKELESVDVTVDNFTGTLGNVDERIGAMRKYQEQSRRHLVRDWYLVSSNNRYVQLWSIAQCIVIILSSTLQVYFVRKLFEIKNVTPTSKPRA